MKFQARTHLRLPSLLLAAGASFVLFGCSETKPAPEPIRAVRTQIVAPESVGGSLEYSAEVKARRESRLSFRVGGKLVQRHAQLGDHVKAGQVLARLDPLDLQLGQQAASAVVASAQTSHDLAAADLKRYKDLRDQGFISSAELDRRDATLQAARAQLDQARAQLSVQGNQAKYAALVADTSGVVTGVDADPGTVLAAGSPVLRVAEDGPRDVVFSVSEDKLPMLRALESAPGLIRVKTWGDTGESRPATVREVAAAADPVTRTFLVKADAGTAPLTLGQTATVTIELPSRPGVTRLPLSAIGEVQGKSFVWLFDPASSTVRQQNVEIGGASGNAVVVASGLQPGQEVVTAGVHVLTAGQHVKRYVDPRLPVSASSAGKGAAVVPGTAPRTAPATAPTPTPTPTPAPAPMAPAQAGPR